MKFEDVEKVRTVYKDALLKRIWIAVGIVILLVLLSAGLFSFGSFPLFSLMSVLSFSLFFGVAAFIIIIFSVRRQRQSYHHTYKGYFVQRSLANIFSNIVYEREKGISSEYLRATGMVNTGDRYSANDYVHGKYKDVAFTQSDVHIEVEHTDSDGDTTYTTIFKGRFMIFDFPKKFSFRLEVAEKGFGANLVPGGRSKDGRRFEKVDLESSEFNGMFRTYAEDGFEAFYILDPSLINNIIELGEKYKGKLLFCFLDNHLVVGLNDNKDAFEPPSVFKEIDEKTETEKVTREINLITDFVDQLKLNRKIFK